MFRFFHYIWFIDSDRDFSKHFLPPICSSKNSILNWVSKLNLLNLSFLKLVFHCKRQNSVPNHSIFRRNYPVIHIPTPKWSILAYNKLVSFLLRNLILFHLKHLFTYLSLLPIVLTITTIFSDNKALEEEILHNWKM